MNDELNPKDVAGNPKDIVEELDVEMLEDFMMEHSSDEKGGSDDDFSMDEFYNNDLVNAPEQSSNHSDDNQIDNFGMDSDDIPDLADFNQSTDFEDQDDFTFDDETEKSSQLISNVSISGNDNDDFEENSVNDLGTFDDFEESPQVSAQSSLSENENDIEDHDFNSPVKGNDDFDSVNFDINDEFENEGDSPSDTNSDDDFSDSGFSDEFENDDLEPNNSDKNSHLDFELNGDTFEADTDSISDEFSMNDDFDSLENNINNELDDFNDFNFEEDVVSDDDGYSNIENTNNSDFTEDEFLKESRDDNMFEEQNREEDELLVELSSSVIPQKKNITPEVTEQDSAKEEPKKKVKAEKKQTSKSGHGALPLILCGITSSLASIGAIIGYQTLTTDDERMSDDDIRVLVNGAVTKATKKLEMNIKESNQVMESNSINDIRQEIGLLQSQYDELNSSITNNNTNIEKISKSNIALNDAIKDVSLKQIESEKTLLEISTKTSGNAAFDKSTALKAIFKLSKKIEALETSTKNKITEIEKQITESNTENKQKLIETKEALIKQLGEVRDVAETAELKLKDLQLKNGGNAVQSALGLGSGVNIVKGELPEIPYKGVIQGKAFLVVPVEGGGEKVLGFSVGQYLDGYGRITEINPDPRNTTILTESGYVNLIRKP